MKKKQFTLISETILYLIYNTALSFWGIYIVFQPTINSRFALMQTDPGDTRLNNYFLEHSFQTFFNRSYSGDLWSPSFYYSYPEVLAFSDNLFASAPIYWIVRSFLSADIAFQGWMIICCLLNFFIFTWLLRKFKVSPILSSLAGFLFAFGMPRVSKLGHQQLLPQFFTPLAFLALWTFAKSPTLKNLILLLTLSYAQILSGIYLGWFLLFSIPICLGVIYFRSSQYRASALAFWRTQSKQIIASLLSWLLLLVVTLLPYIKAKFVFGGRSYAEIDTMLPRLASWFAATPGSIWFPKFGWISEGLPMRGEHFMFAGVAVVALTILTIFVLWKYKNILSEERKLLISVCLLTFFIIFLLSFRFPFGISLWRLIFSVVPGASVIRAVSRIWTIAYFYLFIGIFVCLDSVIHATPINRYVRLFLLTLLSIFIIAEQRIFPVASYEKAPWLTEEQAIATLMSNNCTVAYIALDPAKPAYANHLSAMWGGIKANVPVVNGYSGNVPPSYPESSRTITLAEVLAWLERGKKTSSPGTLCYIKPKNVALDDPLLFEYGGNKPQSSEGNFELYPISFPFAKKFSQKIVAIAPERLKTSSISSTLKVSVIIKNTSNFSWSTDKKNTTSLSYRWLDSQGKVMTFDGDGDRTPLPFDVSPGETIAITAKIRTPPQPGRYQLVLTMVTENEAWFYDRSDKNFSIPIEVTSL